MINEDLWINPYHGLELHPNFKEGERGNENGILFLVEYYFLKALLGKLKLCDVAQFELIVNALQTYDSSGKQIPGLYDRGAGESLTIPPEKRRTISRDNLLAIGSFSDYTDLKYADDIYKYGMKNSWRFDNVQPEDPRWARFMWNIPDIFAMCFYAKKTMARIIGYLGLWSVYASNLYSVLTKYKVRPAWYQKIEMWFKGEKIPETRKDIDTSGPWLVFMKMFPLVKRGLWSSRIMWKLYTWILNRQHKEGWKFVADYYFKNPEHPCRLLMAEVWKKDPYLFS